MPTGQAVRQLFFVYIVINKKNRCRVSKWFKTPYRTLGLVRMFGFIHAQVDMHDPQSAQTYANPTWQP